MTELHDDLDAFVLDDAELAAADRAADEQSLAVEVEPPPDADKANVLLRTVRGIDRELRRIDMLATQEIERITSWRDDRSHGLQRRREHIAEALEAWMRAVNRLNPKRKTESLPNGKLTLRAARGKVVIVDEAKFVDWWRSDVRMSVAKYLGEQLARDDMNIKEISAEIVELTLSRSPLVRVKIEPNKTGIGELPTGRKMSSGGDETASSFVLDGEEIPHVAFVTSAVDTFNVQV